MRLRTGDAPSLGSTRSGARPQFTAEALRKMAPPRVPVRVLPHPMHAGLRQQPDRARFGFEADVCVVLAAFDLKSTSARKNPLGAVRGLPSRRPDARRTRDPDLQGHRRRTLVRSAGGTPGRAPRSARYSPVRRGPVGRRHGTVDRQRRHRVVVAPGRGVRAAGRRRARLRQMRGWRPPGPASWTSWTPIAPSWSPGGRWGSKTGRGSTPGAGGPSRTSTRRLRA